MFSTRRLGVVISRAIMIILPSQDPITNNTIAIDSYPHLFHCRFGILAYSKYRKYPPTPCVYGKRQVVYHRGFSSLLFFNFRF